ncbi:MAG: diaminopimelate dehydrogenase, partial [Alcaligenes sp.]
MSSKIRVGIAGYGNLGRGVELALAQNPDMELVSVFTRRDPASLQLQSAGVPVRALDQIEQYRNDIDVLILCGGSKNDLPEQGPALARWFTTVDSFDTHARIPEYYAAVDAAAQGAGTTALIAVGWDPGLFSLNRLYGECVLPVGQTYTFWGKGLSQGHSDAIRRVAGVAGGVQYTLPIEAAVQRVRNGEQ